MKLKLTIPAQSLRIEIPAQEIEVDFELVPPVIPPFEPPIDLNPEDPIILDWNTALLSGSFELQSGRTYLVPTYSTHIPTNDIHVFCQDGNNPPSLYFGSKTYSEWNEGPKQDRFLFYSERMQHRITIENVNLFCASKVKEVQPFILTIFGNTAAQNQDGTYQLINVKTNCESGFLYSGQQDTNQVIECRQVDFEGIMFEELKANNGGGLLSIKDNCKLVQVDPITYFHCGLTLINDHTFESEIPFSSIENIFIENGNSCNIIYSSGMTFYLPKSSELGKTKTIRPIPKEGDLIVLQSYESGGVKYLRTKSVELQAGDVINVNGIDCLLERKDRSHGSYFHSDPWGNGYGYWIDFYPSNQDLPIGDIEVTVKKSSGLSVIGRKLEGYMIFKYNKHFQTNIEVDHGLEYMLASNPFGVLCYNHQEITVDWKNTEFKGYYRQTNSGVGRSNYYKVENCTGLGNEFNQPVLK